MYFWNTKKLVEDFKNDDVSQKEAMKYLIAISLFMVLGTFLSELFPSDELSDKESMYLYIEYLLITLITIIGVYLCYEKNEKVDSKNFIERFVCFALPIGIKSFLLILTIFIGMAIIHGNIKSGGFEAYMADPFNEIKYSIFYELFFYQGVYRAIGKLKQQEETPQLA